MFARIPIGKPLGKSVDRDIGAASGQMRGVGCRPPRPLTLTMLPPPCSIMYGMTARIVRT
jgi:hypothetical protein